jgi:hypothetical protein
MDRQTIQWLIPALLAIGAAGALWYYWISVNKLAPEPVSAASSCHCHRSIRATTISYWS